MFRVIPSNAFGVKSIVRIRDIDAVVNNYKLLRVIADKTGSICGVTLKGDVHGLGIKDVAPALYREGARYFFIEELCEGIELRELLPSDNARIYALAGLPFEEEEYFLRFNIIPCLNCIEQIERWNSFCAARNIKKSAIIHLDTHMNRLGLLDDEIDMLGRDFDRMTSNINVDFYMSHFYDIKGADHANCLRQIQILDQYLSRLPLKPITFACTDSMILLDSKMVNYEMVRPGIGLVGGAPNAQNPISPDAKHTVEIYAKVSQIKNVKKGETIGYGGAYRTKKDMTIALAHIGYKDGYLRSLSETDADPKGVYMYIDKYRVPIVGKISLGAATIDVTDVPAETLHAYKYAEVVGPNVDIKFLADRAGCYEILVSLGRPNLKVADYTLSDFMNLFPS